MLTLDVMPTTLDRSPRVPDVPHQPEGEVDYSAAPAVVCALDDSPPGRRALRLAARIARHRQWRLVLVPPADGDENQMLLEAARDERAGLIVARAA